MKLKLKKKEFNFEDVYLVDKFNLDQKLIKINHRSWGKRIFETEK